MQEDFDRIRAARAGGRNVFTGRDVDVLLYFIDHGKMPDPDDIPGWARKLIHRWHHKETRDNHDYFAARLEEAAKGRR